LGRPEVTGTPTTPVNHAPTPVVETVPEDTNGECMSPLDDPPLNERPETMFPDDEEDLVIYLIISMILVPME